MHITPQNRFPLFAQHLPANPVIVEAGAFIGTDTLSLARYFPTSSIHAFEPVPAIFEQLFHATHGFSSIRTYKYALSNTTGTQAFYLAQNPQKPDRLCQAGSLCQPKERLARSPITYPSTIEVPTITLDAWAQAYSIDHVDFLWLDLQGAELAALQNCPTLLTTVKLIYVEVHFIEAYQGQPLYSTVHTWLTSQGFCLIGKDFLDESRWFFGNALYAKNH